MSAAPLVVAARRSPIGTAGQALAGVAAAELAAPVVAAVAADLTEATGLRPEQVVLGNCMGPGGNLARVTTLLAGLGDDVPALTVDRQCASGLSAILDAVAAVRLGSGPVLAGGVESASTAPWRMWAPAQEGEDPVRYERAPFAPADRDPDMGLANDLYAERSGITRAAQDEYAARSHRRAYTTREAGGFDDEVVAVAGVTRDERPRGAMTAHRLGRLPAAFREGGAVTAGNACGINDGAAIVAVVADRPGLVGLRVRSVAVTAGDPTNPGGSLVPASRMALQRAGVSLGELDAVELNEAFAGQILACCAELGLDPEMVCPDGGALGLGHPWGASGAVLVVRLFSRLVRSGRGGLGLASIAAGGGQGVAVVVEAVLP